MATGHELAGKKLPLIIAFTVLLVAAFGAGCNGFFQAPTLSSVAIQPPTPSVEVGQTTTVQAWGVYSDNSRSQITSGVAWTSDTPDAVCFVSGSSCTASFTGGTATIAGVAPGGSATLTAAAQGISATAQTTAYLGNLTNFQVCQAPYTLGGTCTLTTWDAPSASGDQTQTYYAIATYSTQSGSQTADVTASASFVLTSTPPTAGGISCTDGSDPATCTVTANTAPTGNYTITVTYSGWTGTAPTITVDVTTG
jgi:hypothetical protein